MARTLTGISLPLNPSRLCLGYEINRVIGAFPMKEQPQANWEDIEHDGTLAGFATKNGLIANHMDFDKAILILPRNAYLVDLKWGRATIKI